MKDRPSVSCFKIKIEFYFLSNNSFCHLIVLYSKLDSFMLLLLDRNMEGRQFMVIYNVETNAFLDESRCQ